MRIGGSAGGVGEAVNMAGLSRNRTYLAGKAVANGKCKVNLRRTAVEEAVVSRMKRRPRTREGHAIKTTHVGNNKNTSN